MLKGRLLFAALASLSAFVGPVACSGIDAPVGSTPLVTRTPSITSAADPVIVAAGDISCGTGTAPGLPCKDAETAALIAQVNPTAVILLGDNQYENGTLADYNTFYDPTWGAYKSITFPSAGNHEYNTSAAVGYYDYFNGVGVQVGRAGDRSKGYYSFSIGSWHAVVLNSNCASIGGCAAGSPQEQWLRADLAANPAMCTVAYWHHPLFSSGGNNASMQAIWQALYDYNADLVLSGHVHSFERLGPQTATATLDNTRGIRSFVVGTGGKNLTTFGTPQANSELRNNTSLGILQLTLHSSSFDWQFVPIPGHTLADAGTASCHDAAPPPPQTTLTILPSADAHVLKNTPNRNYGSANPLLVDGSPVARGYLKFAVSGIGSKTIVSAKLRLYAVDPSNSGGRLHRVSSTSWAETTIKWSNKPSYNAAVVGTLGSVVVNTWYEIDVMSQVSGDGTISFALESTSTNGADYSSRESGAATSPQLVIVVQ